MKVDITAKGKIEALKDCLKPFDIIRFNDGEVAFIKETNVNSCQNLPDYISYSISFLTSNKGRHRMAWYIYGCDEFEHIGNMLTKVAESMAHNHHSVQALMSYGFNKVS